MLEVLQQPALTQGEKARTDVLRVNEIFYSIQGEGLKAGSPCIFIRLTGCGLRCTYCDTEYAFYEGIDLSVNDIFDRIASYDCKLVELTGGEPLEQAAVFPLMSELCDRGYDVMIETGGHIDISTVDHRVKRIVDLKTPSSGMMKRNHLANIDHLTKNDEIKFVIGSEEDYHWARSLVGEYDLPSKAGTVFMSPVFGTQPLQELASWILADGLNVRMQVQLHKLIWPNVERGV